jgi:hypothetical protein
MNQAAGPSGGDAARGASSAALKGAVLIGLAVLIGIVLLHQVGDNTSTAAAKSTTTKPKTTTTKPKAKSTTTTTTVPAVPQKTPAELKLIVLNGGAKQGDAGTMSTKLRTAGYTNQAQANDWTGHQQTGNTVLCKPGLDREAVALSQQTALQGSTVHPWPNPPPPTYGYAADCVVVVGA